jgi:hypothetical protein
MKTKFSLALCVLACAGSVAFAQARYNCTFQNGVSYQSDRACPGISVYGALPERQTNTYIPKMGEAQAHLQYLSSRCSSLSEGIRTGPARGVKYEVTAELQRNYQRECAEEEREARNKLNAQRNDAANAKKSNQQVAALGQQQMQAKQQQCDESKRIIFNKKKRTDLSEGEQQELQRFMQNFKERCE